MSCTVYPGEVAIAAPAIKTSRDVTNLQVILIPRIPKKNTPSFLEISSQQNKRFNVFAGDILLMLSFDFKATSNDIAARKLLELNV